MEQGLLRGFEWATAKGRAPGRWLYKYLYTNDPASDMLLVVAEPSPPDVVFEGNSLSMIRGFPTEVRENLGADLRRLQNGERPLDSGSMSPALTGVFELRDQDKATWYRVLYVKMGGVVYVLHCFTKKTNQTPKGDIEIGRKRLSDLKARLAKQKK